jgi:hypothetical protein
VMRPNLAEFRFRFSPLLTVQAATPAWSFVLREIDGARTYQPSRDNGTSRRAREYTESVVFRSVRGSRVTGHRDHELAKEVTKNPRKRRKIQFFLPRDALALPRRSHD